MLVRHTKMENTTNTALQNILSKLGLKVITDGEWTCVRYVKGHYSKYDDDWVLTNSACSDCDYDKLGIIAAEHAGSANEHWLASICLALSRLKNICPEKYRHTEPNITDSFLERQYMYYEANIQCEDIVDQYLADIKKEEEETCK